MRFITALFVMLTLAPPADPLADQGKPNFSGKWSLDIPQSDLPDSPPPFKSWVYIIEHDEPRMKLTRMSMQKRMAQVSRPTAKTLITSCHAADRLRQRQLGRRTLSYARPLGKAVRSTTPGRYPLMERL